MAIITDGPNVIVKVEKLINAEHQLCMGHGIHLAVCDVLYNKKNPPSQLQDSLVIEKGEATLSVENEHVDDIE